MTDEIRALLHIALHAADKLSASMKRWEIEPRAEFEWLVEARDRIRAALKEKS